ncbi:family 16 glycosylhydrolase, partial [Methylobacterium tardum]|uniref:family 16 glycosylhydrolase n=2 Tax=Methylobacterium tardum TaxID=374432 RepID=UPI001EDF6ADC
MLDLTGYKLTFDDEFNTRSISQASGSTTWGDIRSQWRYDANSDIGFGHSSFVDPASGYDPFKVSGGALTITAVPDKTASGYPGSWESGLITTQGSFSQTYGYFEIRADFSDMKGAWDAFWLLPDKPAANPNNLPGWQELDIVEHYGDNDKGVYSTIHTTDQTPNIPWQQNRQVYSELANAPGYHTYGMDWQKDKISFYVDGQFVGSQATPSDMTGPMYLVANLATQSGADVAGKPISSSIDYIRAYSKSPDAVAVIQGTVSAPDGADPGHYGATSANSHTLEAFGVTRLDQVGSGFFLDDSTGSGPSLKLSGSVVTAGQLGGWTPIGAEKTATGYEVAWKMTGADQYTVWNTDANGNYIASPIGTVSGSDPSLLGLEKSFAQDLNNDGQIGAVPKTVEAFGVTRLDQVGSGFFLDDSTGSGPSLKLSGSIVTAGQLGGWTPIGAEKTATGYEVAWKMTGADQYTVW